MVFVLPILYLLWWCNILDQYIPVNDILVNLKIDNWPECSLKSYNSAVVVEFDKETKLRNVFWPMYPKSIWIGVKCALGGKLQKHPRGQWLVAFNIVALWCIEEIKIKV